LRKQRKKLSAQLAKKITKRIGLILDQDPTASLTDVAQRFDISRVGLWILRKKYPELEKAINDAIDDCNNSKLPRRIRQRWTLRLLDGDAGSSEYIFYMMNKFPDEFKDKRFIANLNGTPDDKDFRDVFFGVKKGEANV